MRVFEVFWVFLKLGCTSFGGPIAHLGYFREAFVSKHQWLSEHQYAYFVAISQIIPGPASSQVGFAIGLQRAGILGGVAAFIGFTLPSVILLLIFANYAFSLESAIFGKIISGLTIVAFVVVFQAVFGMTRQLLLEKQHWIIAILVALVVIVANNIWLQASCILIAALSNLLFIKFNNSEKQSKLSIDQTPVSKNLGLLSLFLFGLILAGLPLLSGSLFEHASNFYVSGALVFGGGHVVVPFLESITVSNGLLSEDAFLAGYGITQALPGPMFSFAAYLGYMIEQSSNEGQWSAIMVSMIALGAIFLPGFLLLVSALSFLGAKLNNGNFSIALDGANAAVVGVLSATLYDPIFIHAIDSVLSLLVAVVCLVALIKFKVSVLIVISICLLTNILTI